MGGLTIIIHLNDRVFLTNCNILSPTKLQANFIAAIRRRILLPITIEVRDIAIVLCLLLLILDTFCTCNTWQKFGPLSHVFTIQGRFCEQFWILLPCLIVGLCRHLSLLRRLLFIDLVGVIIHHLLACKLLRFNFEVLSIELLMMLHHATRPVRNLLLCVVRASAQILSN